MKTHDQLAQEHAAMLLVLHTLETSYVDPIGGTERGCAYCAGWQGKHDKSCIINNVLNSLSPVL